MNWKISDKTYNFDVPLDRQERLIESLLETGNPPTTLANVKMVGHPTVNLFGMPGYIFPNRDISSSGRLVVKTGSMVSTPMAVEFSYRFSGDRLQLSQVQTWGAIEIEDVLLEIKAVLE